MSSPTDIRPAQRPGRGRGIATGFGIAVVIVGAMALDTTVVQIGAGGGAEDVSSVAQFGEEQFPSIQASVEERAIEADQLAAAIAEDQAAAGEQYGVQAGIGPVMPVTFTGVVGEGSSGIYEVDVEGVSDELTIRVQTGPAINGTDLRDATGDIAFGQFTNQIEYQNAGAAINDAMKAQVLANIDPSDLTGKTLSVTGVFKLINPENWLITPVRLSVQ